MPPFVTLLRDSKLCPIRESVSRLILRTEPTSLQNAILKHMECTFLTLITPQNANPAKLKQTILLRKVVSSTWPQMVL
jgi:hypothetical protein